MLHRSRRLPAGTECQDRAGYLGLKVRKAGGGQVLLDLGKLEYMKALTCSAPLANPAKLQDAARTRSEREHCKNSRWLHHASHLAQSNRGIGKKMKRATAEDGVENAIFEWKSLYSRPGEMYVAIAFLRGVGNALPQHPPRYVDSKYFLRR